MNLHPVCSPEDEAEIQAMSDAALLTAIGRMETRMMAPWDSTLAELERTAGRWLMMCVTALVRDLPVAEACGWTTPPEPRS